MTPKAQRIAIAEACGWQKIQRPLSDQDGEIPGRFETVWFHPKIHTSIYPMYVLPKNPPDYLNDLNAMHEAESALEEQGKSAIYAEHLMKWHPSYCIDVIDERNAAEDFANETYKIVHATAAQRAEAFLRTVGKWTDADEQSNPGASGSAAPG